MLIQNQLVNHAQNSIENAASFSLSDISIAVVDAISYPVTITDTGSMLFIYSNKAAQDYFGYSEDEFLTLGPAQILNPECPESRDLLEQPNSNNIDNTYVDTELMTKHGRILLAEIDTRPFMNGDHLTIVSNYRDIRDANDSGRWLCKSSNNIESNDSEQKSESQIELSQLKENEEFFRNIAIYSTDGFWETDADFNFVNLSESFVKKTGIDPAYTHNLIYRDIGGSSSKSAKLKFNVDDLLCHRPFRNFVLKHKISETGFKYLDICGIPLLSPDGEFIGYRGTGTDITEQVEQNQQADRVSQELRIAREEAFKASKAKTEFLASMSHELRTPLNCILGYTQLLELSDDTLDEQQIQHVRQILASGEHLLNLISDVLELNTIEEGQMSLQMTTVEIGNLIDECLSQVQLRALERNISIIDQRSTDAPLPALLSDITRLKQLLLNLLSNAIKYNKEGGSVTISCKHSSEGFLRISITDTGAGIPPHRRKDLFSPFDRLGRETGPIEGTGIGLTIAKRVIDLLNGDIGCESELGKGSTFWVDIPVSLESGQMNTKHSSIDEEDQNQAPKKNISKQLLYIEDDPDNQNLMKHILARIPDIDITIFTAHNAESGIDLARIHLPDMILMDINLPGMNGIEAVQKLKQLSETRSIPVVAISADASPQAIDSAIDCGFEDYVTKPIKVKDVQQIVSSLLAPSIQITSPQ